jgi:hypothetical protein
MVTSARCAVERARLGSLWSRLALSSLASAASSSASNGLVSDRRCGKWSLTSTAGVFLPVTGQMQTGA